MVLSGDGALAVKVVADSISAFFCACSEASPSIVQSNTSASLARQLQKPSPWNIAHTTIQKLTRYFEKPLDGNQTWRHCKNQGWETGIAAQPFNNALKALFQTERYRGRHLAYDTFETTLTNVRPLTNFFIILYNLSLFYSFT